MDKRFPMFFGAPVEKQEDMTYIVDAYIADPDGWYLKDGDIYVSEYIFDHLVTP
jgi:hypothetical protein